MAPAKGKARRASPREVTGKHKHQQKKGDATPTPKTPTSGPNSRAPSRAKEDGKHQQSRQSSSSSTIRPAAKWRFNFAEESADLVSQFSVPRSASRESEMAKKFKAKSLFDSVTSLEEGLWLLSLQKAPRSFFSIGELASRRRAPARVDMREERYPYENWNEARRTHGDFERNRMNQTERNFRRSSSGFLEGFSMKPEVYHQSLSHFFKPQGEMDMAVGCIQWKRKDGQENARGYFVEDDELKSRRQSRRQTPATGLKPTIEGIPQKFITSHMSNPKIHLDAPIPRVKEYIPPEWMFKPYDAGEVAAKEAEKEKLRAAHRQTLPRFKVQIPTQRTAGQAYRPSYGIEQFHPASYTG